MVKQITTEGRALGTPAEEEKEGLFSQDRKRGREIFQQVGFPRDFPSPLHTLYCHV